MFASSIRNFESALAPVRLCLGMVVALLAPAAARGLERLPPQAAGPGFSANGYETLPPGVTGDVAPRDEPLVPDPSSWSEGYECCDPNHPSAGLPWVWQWLPDGLVWRSYLGSPKEPRFQWVMSDSSFFGTIWDATLGGRVSLWRYGTPNAYRPNGWEVQLEGAALARIWPMEPSWPLISTDYRVGVPIVYAYGPWQFKTGYAHVSSHVGDEYMILNPTFERINYIRDEWMLAVGYYYNEDTRLYAEVDYAFEFDGGAKPWQLQFGIDWSPAVRGWAPFATVYGNMRQELDYGGFFACQIGAQIRGGRSMHTFRVGVEYVNGASTQFEFFNQFEQRVGFGLFYDY